MGTKLNKYRIWCITEGKYKNTWAEEEPTVCPTNDTHEIASTKTSITDNVSEDSPTDPSNKPWVHQTSRPFGTITYFTGAGDNIHSAGPGQYGTGELFENVHSIDSTNSIEYIYLDFNMIENPTYLHEGYVIWANAKRDLVTMDIVSTATPVVPASNTFFNLYNGYLIVPAAGNGIYNVPSINIIDGTANIDCGLVYMPLNEEGVRPQAFWNATWDSELKLFIDIAAAPLGDGAYNLFAAEVPLFRFINKMILLKDGFLRLQTSDIEQLGHGMRIRGEIETRGAPHAWEFAGWFVLNRHVTL